MSGSSGGWFQLARTNRNVFSDSKTGDMLLRSQNSNQEILIGVFNNSNASMLHVGLEEVHVDGNLDISSNITAPTNKLRVLSVLLSNTDVTASNVYSTSNYVHGIKANLTQTSNLIATSSVWTPTISNAQVFYGKDMLVSGALRIPIIVASNISTSNFSVAYEIKAPQITACNISTSNMSTGNISVQDTLYCPTISNVGLSNSLVISDTIYNNSLFGQNAVIAKTLATPQFSTSNIDTLTANIRSSMVTPTVVASNMHTSNMHVGTYLYALTISNEVLSNNMLFARSISNNAMYTNQLDITSVARISNIVCPNITGCNQTLSNLYVTTFSNMRMSTDTILAGSRIGINTSNPTERLHVEQGRIRVRHDMCNEQLSVHNYNSVYPTEVALYNNGSNIQNRMIIGLENAGTRGAFWNMYGEDAINIKESLTATGKRVGLGTRYPADKLDVMGGIAIRNNRFVDSNRNLFCVNITSTGTLLTSNIDLGNGSLECGTIQSTRIDTQNNTIDIGSATAYLGDVHFNSYNGVLYMSDAEYIRTSNESFYAQGRVLASNTFVGPIPNLPLATDFHAAFAHSNNFGPCNYAIKQNSNGTTYINARQNREVLFRLNNSNVMTMSNARLGIRTMRPVSELDVNGTISMGGCNFVDVTRVVNASNITSKLFFVTESNLGNTRQYGGYYLNPSRSHGIEYQQYLDNNINNWRWATTFLTAEATSGFVFKAISKDFDQSKQGTIQAVISPEGRLGLGGITYPLQTLHVAGSTYVSGKVGIGQSNPNFSLHIESTQPVYIKPKKIDFGQSPTILLEPPFSMNRDDAGPRNYVRDGLVRANFSNVTGWNVMSIVNANRHVGFIQQTGGGYFEAPVGFGFGSCNPVSQVDIRGTMTVIHENAPGIVVTSTSNYDRGAPFISVHALTTSNNQVRGAFSGTLGLSHQKVSGFIESNNTLGRIAFGGNHTSGSSNNVLYAASIFGVAECNMTASNVMNTALTFRTGSNGIALHTSNQDIGIERMRICGNGYIGINMHGMSNPSQYLEVDGNSKFNLRTIIGTSMYNVANNNYDINTTTEPYWLNFGYLASETLSINNTGVMIKAQFGIQTNITRAEIMLQNRGGLEYTTRIIGGNPNVVLESFDIFVLALDVNSSTPGRAFDLFVRVSGTNTHAWNIDATVVGQGSYMIPTPTKLFADPCIDIRYDTTTYKSFFTNYTFQDYAGQLGLGTTNQKGPLHVEAPTENPQILDIGGDHIPSVSSGNPFLPFNKSTVTRWSASSASLPQHITLAYPQVAKYPGYILQKYAITNAPDFLFNNAPAAWQVQGSYDGVDFSTIDTRSGVFWSYALQTKIFEVETDVPYRVFRILITRGQTGQAVSVCQVKLWTTFTRLVVTRDGYVGIGSIAPRNRFHLEGDALMHGRIIVQDAQDGDSNRGIYMWESNDTNWALYMASARNGLTIAHTSPVSGANNQIQDLAIRMRLPQSNNMGFIIENSTETELFSITGSNGMAFIKGNVGITTAPSTYYNLAVGSLTAIGATTKVLGVFGNSSYTTHGKSLLVDDNTGMAAGTITAAVPNSMYMFRNLAHDLRMMRTNNGNTSPSGWITDMIVKGTTGNIGFGVDDPVNKLHINGAANLTTYTNLGWTSNGICFQPDTTGTPNPSQLWGLMQMPDPSMTRSNNSFFVLGRGNSYQERRMTVMLPSTSAYDYATNTVQPTLQFVTQTDSNLVTIRSTDGFVGIGTSNPSHKLYLKDGHAALTLCNFVEFGHNMPTKATNAAKMGYGALSQQHYLDISGAGSNDMSRRVRIYAESGTEVVGALTVGHVNTSNSYISFAGTSNHYQDSYTGGRYTFVGEREYDPASKAAELAIIKLGIDEVTTGGPDRIRHVAANHIFQTYNTLQPLAGSFYNAATATYIDAMAIRQNGFVGLSNIVPLDRLHLLGGGIISEEGHYVTPHTNSKCMYGIFYRQPNPLSLTYWYRLARFSGSSTLMTNARVFGYLHSGSNMLAFETRLAYTGSSSNMQAHTTIQTTTPNMNSNLDLVLYATDDNKNAALYLKCSAIQHTISISVEASDYNSACDLYKTQAAYSNEFGLNVVMVDNGILPINSNVYNVMQNYPKKVYDIVQGRDSYEIYNPRGILHVQDVTPYVYTLPPANFAVGTTTLNSINAYPINGTFSIACSSATTIAQLYNIKPSPDTNFWSPATAYNSDGTYSAGTTTFVNQVGFAGEWVQQNFPIAVRPTTLHLNNGPVGGNIFGFVLLGSINTNNAEWELLHRVSAASAQNTSFPLTTTRKYTSFRLVISKVATGGVQPKVFQFAIAGNVEHHLIQNGYLTLGSNTAPIAPITVYTNSNQHSSSNGILVYNPNNAMSNNAMITIMTGGLSGGNPMVAYGVDTATVTWGHGQDNTDLQKFKIAMNNSNLGYDTRLTITSTGYVGILNSNPQVPLHVQNSNNAAVTNITQSNWLVIFENRNIATNSNTYIGLAHYHGNGILIDTSNSNSAMYALRVFTGGQEYFRATNAGQVIISEDNGSPALATGGTLTLEHRNTGGTSSIVFKSKFDPSDYGYIYFTDNMQTYYTSVSSEMSALFLGAGNNAAQTHGDQLVLKGSFANIYDSTRHYFTNNNGVTYVGINNSNPTAPLHIQPSSGTSPDTNGLYVYNSNIGATSHSIVCVRTSGSTGGNPFVSYDINGEIGWSTGIDNATNSFKIANSWNSLTTTTYMTVKTNGYIGMGTEATDPAYPLHVIRNQADWAFSVRNNLVNAYLAHGNAGFHVNTGDNTASYLINLMSQTRTRLQIDNGSSGNIYIDGPTTLVVQKGVDGGSGQGIFIWNSNDTAWGIYMAQAGGARSLGNGAACVGANNFAAHAVRFRCGNSYTQGFIFENNAEELVASFTGNRGYAYIAGNLGIGINPPTTGYKMEVNGSLKCTSIGLDSVKCKYIVATDNKLEIYHSDEVNRAEVWCGKVDCTNVDTNNNNIYMGTATLTCKDVTCDNYNSKISIAYSTWQDPDLGFPYNFTSPPSTATATISLNRYYITGVYKQFTNAELEFGGSGQLTGFSFTKKVEISGTLTVVGDINTSGTISASNTLTVVGGGANITGDINSSGTISASNDVITSSDRRLKSAFSNVTNALEKLDTINGVTYNRIDYTGDKRFAGMIAQEVQQVLPEAVYETNGYLSISYGSFSALLVEAVKELNTKVDRMKKNSWLREVALVGISAAVGSLSTLLVAYCLKAG